MRILPLESDGVGILNRLGLSVARVEMMASSL